jgi:predicted acetyltransferase
VQLPGYRAALERGWSPDNLRGAAAITETLARIEADAAAFIALTHDPEAQGPPVTLLDGSTRPRIPGLSRWIWHGGAADDEPDGFCGVIGLRWLPGTAELPPHVLGHVGYSVVPWRRGQGHATRALGLLLAVAREQGLPWVDLTTDPDNTASQRVITANGGQLLGAYDRGPAWGHSAALRYRIALEPTPP